ncbi:MAG TPA: NirA family protein [Terracidiphilus sp.]|jgi:ferredoxin-nitrite reductase|nr:NirA family protein [Terracidiphilus sp.]
MDSQLISTPGLASEFTAVQKEYLQGLFNGIAQRGPVPYAGHTPEGQITNDPACGAVNLAAESLAAEEMYFNTPVSDLCREERWKREQNPLDIWDKLLAHANENKAPAQEDIFRFKFHGLFYVAPAEDSFMVRLRIPGAVLTAHQMRGLAKLAAECGPGRADITTRANLQIRELQPKDIVRVLTSIQELGLSSRGSGADNIRNITASPITGIDPTELMDVAPLAEAMGHYIFNSRDLYGLPRKFNIAFDNGGAISVLADTNDIGFVAVRVAEGGSVPPGIYFRVLLCGITGHRQFAQDCGILLRPDQTVAVAAAMVRVFNQNGDRTDRKKARLKYLIDRWGVDKFLQETEKQLAFPLIHFAAEECERRVPIDRAGHIGIHPQKQSGLSYIGVSVPVGRMPAEQMIAVAEIAERFGNGEIRLTVWQNLVIPNIAAGHLEAAMAELLAAGLSFKAGAVLSGTVACTGNQGCRYAATDTKTHAVVLANMLDDTFNILRSVNLHVTGCPHSCAQHYVGDVGLMGVKVGGEEGYQVVLGGGSDQDQGLARELLPAIKFSELEPMMRRLFRAYSERALKEESFLEFTRRHEIAELKRFCQIWESN